MVNRRVFALMLPSLRRVEVIASELATAIRCGCAALPHFVSMDDERGKAIVVNTDIRSTLTCLLCGKVNPVREGANSLIAMQEHLMEAHDITQRELHYAIRIFSGTSHEGQYIWSLDADRTREVAQPYMRASRYTTRMRGARVTDNSLPMLPFTQQDLESNGEIGRTEIALCSVSGGQRNSRVTATGEDELAWYGFLYERSETSQWLVWPKEVWQRLA